MSGNHPVIAPPWRSRGRDFGSADCVSAEEVVVFDVNIELSDRMSQRDNEMLVPLGILGVFQDACASHGGLGEANGDVGIAGDDLTVAADFGVPFFSSVCAGDLQGSQVKQLRR
ncbi:hypothetical protein V6Z11_1Z022500 [Gossypium hirsutum]